MPLAIGWSIADELLTIILYNISFEKLKGKASYFHVGLSLRVIEQEPFQTSETAISLAVRVPVLSVQSTCTEPIVSHEASFFTRLSSLSISLTEKARAKVTAKGNPYGTAITMRATPSIRYCRI